MNKSVVKQHKVIGLTLMSFSIIGVLFLIPLPGVDSSQNLSISSSEIKEVTGQDSKEINFILIDESEIVVEDEEWNALGEYDLLNEELTLATKHITSFGFMSTCSHEIKHVKTPETGGPEIHDEMNTVLGFVMPWDWETECFYLLDNRLNIS